MKKFNVLILTVLFSHIAFAQGFYDLETIQTIEITFEQSNWDALLDEEKAGDENYIMAQNVTINGVVLDSVGVKYKGNSTYNANQTKNPFHIELDTYKEHDYEGYTDIKLSNVANDPSFLREVLSYQILRQYMDAPLSNYANVYVNGNLIGLYSNSEAVSKKFVNSRFGSKTNTFIKCNPPDGAGPTSTVLSDLIYNGTDSTDYYEGYELKSDYGWDELIHLCDTLSNNIADIEKILDVDRALWMIAYDNALVNLDSYIGAFAQNYYLYRDDNGRFVPVVWDLNESFGRFSQTGTSNLNSTSDKQEMSHLLHESDSSFPLIKKLLSIPMYKRMYIAHLKTIMTENFDDGSYYQTGLTFQSTIDAAVQADNNKFYTYNNFLDNLTTDVTPQGPPGPGTTSTPGITNLMDGRNSYLLALSDFTKIAPSISSVTVSNSAPVVNENVIISAAVSSPTAVYLGYRNDSFKTFTRVQMYDNGTNGDATASDGIYSISIPVNNVLVQYYIYAENSNAGMFSPNRAEHEFHSFTATAAEIESGDVVINEFMASNEFTVADNDGEYEDWIELYNNTSSDVDLVGYYMSDTASDLMQWAFPEGTTIAANGYLIIWADKDEDQIGIHANFKLSADAEAVLLVNSAGEIVDEIAYTNQVTDISFGRYPNGTGAFQPMIPTFNAENTNSTAVDELNNATEIMTYPNPASNYFYLNIDNRNFTENEVKIYNVLGEIVYQNSISAQTQVDASHWATGLYIIKTGTSTSKLLIAK